MKGYLKTGLFFLVMVSACCCRAQHDSATHYVITPFRMDSNRVPVVEQPKVFQFVENEPVYPGGDRELMKFLQANIHYPDVERVLAVEGKVLLRFVVDENGAVQNVVIIRSVSPGLDKEAVRVLKLLPHFIPGKQEGKAVKVYFNLPVVYRLTSSGNNDFLEHINALAANDFDFKVGLDCMRKYDFMAAEPLIAKSAKKYKNANIYDMLWVCCQQNDNKKGMCDALKKAIGLGHKDEVVIFNKLCE